MYSLISDAWLYDEKKKGISLAWIAFLISLAVKLILAEKFGEETP